MSNIAGQPGATLRETIETMEREKARLLERAARDLDRARGIDRDIVKMVEAERIAAEYSGVVIPGGNSALTQPRVDVPHQPPILENKFLSFDGTFGGLIDFYRSYEKSPYQQLKYNVRLSYDQALNRLKGQIGNVRIESWGAEQVQSFYDEKWAAGGKIAMGHLMVGKLRTLTGFGSVVLNDDACTRLSAILSNMRFPTSRGRTDILSVDQARDIRAAAHQHFNWGSIALAQAFLITLPMLRVVDIIGEWVPTSEPGMSDITKGNEKWLRGLRWSDIDENMVLRRVLTSGRKNQQKEVEFNLKKRGGIIEEINRAPLEKRVGPMIICEFSNLPWTAAEFRRKWRIVADKAGVPASVKISDSVRARSSEDEDSELRADTAL